MSNQWKERGDCRNCTKKGYCNKSCAAHKRRTGDDDRRVKREALYVLGTV